MLSIFKRKNSINNQIDDLVKERNKLVLLKREKAIEYIKLMAENAVKLTIITNQIKRLEQQNQTLINAANDAAIEKKSLKDGRAESFLKSSASLLEQKRNLFIKEEQLKDYIKVFDEVIEERTSDILKLQYEKQDELQEQLSGYLAANNLPKSTRLKCVHDRYHDQVGIYLNYCSTPLYNNPLPSSTVADEQKEKQNDINDYFSEKSDVYTPSENSIAELINKVLSSTNNEKKSFQVVQNKNDIYVRKWLFLSNQEALQLKNHFITLAQGKKLG